MNRLSSSICTLFVLLVLTTTMMVPQTALAAQEATTLQNDCAGVMQPDCFEDAASMLDWIWNTRTPSQLSPLLVNIGPGTHLLPTTTPFCDNGGDVTFRGSGVDNTIISGGYDGSLEPVMRIFNCDRLSFEDMTIRSDLRRGLATGSESGINWAGGGKSTWTNINVQASAYGWTDGCNTGETGGEHYWFGSKVESANHHYSIGYHSTCGDNWFYGGEISAFKDQPFSGIALIGVLTQSAKGEVRIFGSAVRSTNTTNASTAAPLAFGHGGLFAQSGMIHMHGGIVSVQSKDPGLAQTLFGVRTTSGFIHTPDTAFTVKTNSTGVARRIMGPGATDSPFLWPNGIVPPTITSNSGSDLFVEIDCASSGDCSAGTETHMMIYNSACNDDGPWFNATLGRCRGDIQ